ncbi:MAG: hypothetical protein ACTSYA_12020 [Candidatus Kariarchaeaceae archaeon]
MAMDESQLISDSIFTFLTTLTRNFLWFFAILMFFNICMEFARRAAPNFHRILRIIFFFGGMMHSYWHIFAARLLGYHVNFNFLVVWNQQDVSAFGITLNRNRQPGNLKDAFLIGYAPSINLLIIAGLLALWPLMEENQEIIPPPILWIWAFILLSLFLFGTPDVTDLLLPLEALMVYYPFLVFELIWGFFFGIFLFANMDVRFATFLLLIYSIAVLYVESGSSFLIRREKRVSEPWERFIARVDT